jgi:hypothetical protein
MVQLPHYAGISGLFNSEGTSTDEAVASAAALAEVHVAVVVLADTPTVSEIFIIDSSC